MPTTSPKRLLAFWNGINLVLLVSAFAHQSTSPAVLGRYTPLYAASLVASLALVILVLTISRFWSGRLLASFSSSWDAGAALLLFAGTTALWLVPFDASDVKLLFTFNAVCLGMWIASAPAKDDEPRRRWQPILSGVLLLILVVAFFSARSVPPEQSSGDESYWTDMAITWLRTGQAYFRIGAWTPLPISPGYGYWVVALAGWTQVFGISLASGRLFMWAVYALAVLAITVAGWRLYDRWVGLLGGLVLAGSAYVLSTRIVRPELGLAVVGSLLILLRLRKQPVWALVSGLVVTLSLEIHASALAYIVAVGGVYFTDLFLERDDPLRFRRFAFLVIGGLIGGALYAYFNILSLPDPGYFFTALRGERGFLSGYDWQWFERALSIYGGRAPLELIVVALALVALILRRGKGDGLLLRFLAFTIIGYAIFVPGGERYLIVFAPFCYLAIAALACFGLDKLPGGRRLAGAALAIFCLCSPALARMLPAVQANILATGDIPTRVQRVRELSSLTTIIVGDANDYWWFTEYGDYYTFWAEYSHTLEIAEDLWARINPDIVYFTAYPGSPEISPLLKQWMDDGHYISLESVESDGFTTLIWRRPGYNPPSVVGYLPNQ